tara:strand:- start:122 stop:427 length:306 start_codon:yes stop_codon:yes gene_type:complete
MGFFLSPIKFVFELIGFLLSAAFVYGLALIAAVTIIWYGVIDLKSKEPTKTVIEYVTVVEKHEVTKFVEKGPELTCTRVTGCELFPNAKTEEEYCPTCVIK